MIPAGERDFLVILQIYHNFGNSPVPPAATFPITLDRHEQIAIPPFFAFRFQLDWVTVAQHSPFVCD